MIFAHLRWCVLLCQSWSFSPGKLSMKATTKLRCTGGIKQVNFILPTFSYKPYMCTGGMQQVNYILHFLSILYTYIQGEWNKLILSSLPDLIKVIYIYIRFIKRSREDKVNLFHFPCAAKSKCIVMFLLIVSFFNVITVFGEIHVNVCEVWHKPGRDIFYDILLTFLLKYSNQVLILLFLSDANFAIFFRSRHNAGSVPN